MDKHGGKLCEGYGESYLAFYSLCQNATTCARKAAKLTTAARWRRAFCETAKKFPEFLRNATNRA